MFLATLIPAVSALIARKTYTKLNSTKQFQILSSRNYVVDMRTDLLSEVDDLMLKHGIEEMILKSLYAPMCDKRKPNRYSLYY